MDIFIRRLRVGVVAALVVVNSALWLPVLRAEKDALTVSFLDVGQGDAALIEAPNGNRMLIDGGPDESVLVELAHILPWWDRTIDVVLATHPDADHVGGLPAVLDRYRVPVVLRSGVEADTDLFDAFNEAVAREGSRVFFARRGLRVRLGVGAAAVVLFPEHIAENVRPNDASATVLLSYAGAKALFSGDAPQRIERYLVRRYGAHMEAGLLKTGHHGSDTSSARDFIGVVSPEYAVISAGRRNPYGHPHEEVVRRLRQFGAKIFRTDRVGTAIFETDGAGWIPK